MTYLPNGAPIAAIPEALRRRAQWILWRLDRDKDTGEPTKVPYTDLKRKARANDPKTWLPFDEAVRRWAANPNGWAGIGYEFSEDDPYTGIDLDACLDPATGAVEQWADRELGELLPTYAEVSPSEKGIKLWVETEQAHKLGPTKDIHELGGVEVYSSGRFFAVTGRAFENAQPRIAPTDDAVIEQIIAREQERRNARRPKAAQPQNNRSVSDHTPLSISKLSHVLDRLSADRWASYDDWLRIGMALHHWADGDPHRLQTAYALYDQYSKEQAPNCYGKTAEKWASFGKLNGHAGDVTVGTLIRWAYEDDPPADGAPSDQPSDQQVRSHARFTVAPEDALSELPPIRYLDRELGLVASAFHLIYGASGSGKTFYAIERAMRQVELGRRVLYIPTEDVQGLRYRVAAWRLAHPDIAGRLTWLQMPEGLDLQDYNQVAELIEAVQPYEYDHIVLDTLREAHSGDENSSQDTRRINRAIQRLVVTGAAIDVVHHTGVNGERPRGSTALFGNADAVIKIEDDDGAIRVSFDKIRNAPPRDPLIFGMVQQDTGLCDTDGEPVVSVVLRPAGQFTRRDAKLSPIQRKVLETLALSIFTGIGAKAQQVIDTAEITRRNVYLALSILKTRGYVTQGDKGDPYYITTAGRAQLGPRYELQPSDQPDSALKQASDPVFAATPPASDHEDTAPESPSDQSDQVVITSDQSPTASAVITSDHTRRVITRSHADHLADHTHNGGVVEESLPDDLPAVEDTYARLKRQRDERQAAARSLE